MISEIWKCPLSEKCKHYARSRREGDHLSAHAIRRRKPFLKVRVLPGEVFVSNNIQIKNSFRNPIYVSIKEHEDEKHKYYGTNRHEDWKD